MFVLTIRNNQLMKPIIWSSKLWLYILMLFKQYTIQQIHNIFVICLFELFIIEPRIDESNLKTAKNKNSNKIKTVIKITSYPVGMSV